MVIWEHCNQSCVRNKALGGKFYYIAIWELVNHKIDIHCKRLRVVLAYHGHLSHTFSKHPVIVPLLWPHNYLPMRDTSRKLVVIVKGTSPITDKMFEHATEMTTGGI